jgi:hypothetical protein
MPFATFDITNNYLTGNNFTHKDMCAGAVAYFKSAANVADYEAYQRQANFNGGQMASDLLAHFNIAINLPTPVAIRNSLYARIDQMMTHIQLVAVGLHTAELNARTAHWGPHGAGAGTFPDFEEYAHHGWRPNRRGIHLRTPRIATGYLDLLAAEAQPYTVETEFNPGTENYHKAAAPANQEAATNAIAAARASLLNNALSSDNGALNETHAHWKRITACAAYWTREAPRTAGRAAAIAAMAGFVPGNGNDAVTMIRTGQAGERTDIGATEIMRQSVAVGQAQSFEREKWFYTSAAIPGPGVVHPYRFTLTMKAGAMALLAQLAVDDGNFGAVVTKAAEPNCYGIHEEALPAFHHLIRSIRITSNHGAPVAPQTIAVNR